MDSKQVSLDEIISAYKKWFLSFGLTEQNIRSYYPVWMEEQKGSGTVNEYVWHLFNLLLAENAEQTSDKRQFHNYKASILKRMMEFARKYEEKNANEILRQLELERMHEYEQCPYEIEVEISSLGCCPYCDTLNNHRYTIEQYRNEQPLGSTNCTNEKGCTCSTVAVPLMNESGEIVMKN